MEINCKIIAEIAENLDLGMLCYLHKRTGNLKTIIDEMRWLGADIEAWEEDMEEIEVNRTSYVEFEAMNSHQSFEVMLDFMDTLDDAALKVRLEKALSRSKPFRHFKDQIEDQEEGKEKWYAYKKERYIDFVKQQAIEYGFSIS